MEDVGLKACRTNMFGGRILGCFWAEYRTLSSGPDAAVLNMMNMSGGIRARSVCTL